MQEGSRILEKQIFLDSGEIIKVVYELIQNIKDESFSYGIAISTYNPSGELDEFVEIADISENFIEIHSLFMVLYKCEVTPITLYDVMDVLLADSELLDRY